MTTQKGQATQEIWSLPQIAEIRCLAVCFGFHEEFAHSFDFVEQFLFSLYLAANRKVPYRLTVISFDGL
jgi:hypothetical protein